jgi:hypothetical protein
MESPQERRIRETLERCTTPAQRATCERLHDEGKTAYPEKRQGQTVISEFLRYCQHKDPTKIRQGLYHFSIGGAGGLNEIAHYNLGGFQHVYWHPHIYIEQLLLPELARGRRIDHSSYVYTDGMTAQEVGDQMLAIANAAYNQVAEDYEAKVAAAALAQATRLAESIGMKVVPG